MGIDTRSSHPKRTPIVPPVKGGQNNNKFHTLSNYEEPIKRPLLFGRKSLLPGVIKAGSFHCFFQHFHKNPVSERVQTKSMRPLIEKKN